MSTPVFWPGEFHGLYPWGHKESEMMSDFYFLVIIFGYLCFLPMQQFMCFHWKQEQGGSAYVQVNILFLPLVSGYIFVHFS